MDEKFVFALGVVWLSSTPLQAILQILHSMRDKVVAGLEHENVKVSASLELKYCKAMLWNTYIPLLIGYLVFLLMISSASLFLPIVGLIADMKIKLISYAVSVQFGLTFLGFFFGGIGDIRLMRIAIEEKRLSMTEPGHCTHAPSRMIEAPKKVVHRADR